MAQVDAQTPSVMMTMLSAVKGWVVLPAGMEPKPRMGPEGLDWAEMFHWA
jgi:hypothetical protein